MIGKSGRRVFTILTAAALSLTLSRTAAATLAIDSWRLWPAYSNATKLVSAFDHTFVLSDGSLYSISTDGEMASLYTYDKIGGLSDCQIADIAYSDTQNILILAYANGNLDLLSGNDEMVNCPDIVMGDAGTISMGRMLVEGRYAYLPIGAGLVKFDLQKREISLFCRMDGTVNSVAIHGNRLYCATSNAIITALVDSNLLDPASWQTLSKGEFSDIFTYKDGLYAYTKQNKLYSVNALNGSFKIIETGLNAVPRVIDDMMYVAKDSILNIYSGNDSIRSYKLPHIVCDAFYDDDNILWTACGKDGVDCYINWSDDNENTLYTVFSALKPQGPRRNALHSISWPQDGKMLAVSGCQNYQGIEWPGAIITFENDRWECFDETVSAHTGLKYIDLTEAAVDPLNPDRILVGSARQGLYEFNNGEFSKHYTWDNSGLQSILDHHKYDYVSVSSLMFDSKGNLWMTNNEVDTIIKVLKADGTWAALYYPEISGIPTFKQMKQDSNGVLWINSSRGLHPGIVAIDYGGTIDNTADDVIKFVSSSFTNQDGKSQEIYDIFCYDFDRDGAMWICTNSGIFVLREPWDFLKTQNPVFERVKINRNDGSGLADYLFEGVMTTALFIDQGNRKWIGTLNNGVYLLSADGTQTLEHFTADNSPLPDNNILFITQDARDGSIFFATELGLAQYGGQGRQAEITLDKPNMEVYPNPVMPDNDYVTVTGLTDNSIVKITNTKGKLLYQSKSIGGSLSWNLKDAAGKEVPSGIYHAIVNDGKQSHTVNITVIK